MNESALMAKVHQRLDRLSRSTQRLQALLARGKDVGPMHEVRLATRLADVGAVLHDLVELTTAVLAVQDTAPAETRTS